jgi:hypothetical protein
MNARRRDESKQATPTTGEATASPDVLASDEADEFSAEAAPEAVPFSASADRPNPLEPAYLLSKDHATGEGKEAKGEQFRVPPAPKTFTEDRAKKALALVRRAASDHEGGARTRIRKEGDGFALYFAWKPASVRQYTTAMVREWAKGRGITVPEKGRVPLAVVNQYRTAHGLPESKGGARKATAGTPAS